MRRGSRSIVPGGAGAGARKAGSSAPPRALGYRRLAAAGLLAPAGFLVAHGLETGATGFLDQVSVFFQNFPDPRMVLYSIMLIALMLTRPTGLFGTSEIRTWWRQKRARREAAA